MGLSVIVVAMILSFDIGLLYFWGMGEISFLTVLFLHFVECSVLLIVATLQGKEQAWFSLLAFPIVLALGPLGAAGILLSALLYSWYRKTATPFEVWYNEILPSQTTPPAERLMERLYVWNRKPEMQQDTLVHFIDIMKSGSRDEKQTVIDLMRNNFHPDFSPVLKGALGDACNIVRSHAVAAITKIEEAFQSETYKLERYIRDVPDDFDALLKLARHYDEYANSGLSDNDLLKSYRHKAEQLYCDLLEKCSEDVSIHWSLGRLLIRDGRFKEAADVIESALNIADDAVQPMQRIWYWECLYNLQRFTKLREEIHRHRLQVLENADLPQDLLDSIDLWADIDAVGTSQ